MEMKLAISLVIFLWAVAPAAAAEPDLIFFGGKVFRGPGRYAQAVAIGDNRISDVGFDADILRLKGEKTAVVDLRGRAVTPGFHDAHAHFLKGALFLNQVDLNGAKSLAEIKKRVAAYASSHPEADWILGRGWEQAAFADPQAPTREALDAVVSTRPVALTQAGGRGLWMNTEGLRRAHITKTTSNLNKGEIALDASGRPTGLLREDAVGLAARFIPRPTRAQKLDALRKALALARELGVTSVDSMPDVVDIPPREQADLWSELYRKQETTLRFFMYGRLEDASEAAALRKTMADFPRTRFGVVGAKGFVDGTIDARTAALFEPYFDDPKTAGKPLITQGRLDELVRRAHALGLQTALSAAGDRAVRMALNACEKSEDYAKKESLVLVPYPCRVERADVVSTEDAPRFKTLAAASMQPGRMAYADEVENYNPERLGGRVQQVFAWKTLEDAGAQMAFGSDWPMAALDPRVGLFAATTRRNFNGRPAQGWIPKQKISLEDAVEHYTASPARLIGREEELGSIAPGKLADLVVFDRDLFSTSGLDLLAVKVDYTIYDGRIVYERKDLKP